MSDFRPEELAHAKRPPTTDELAAMKRMPTNVAVGWLHRKRAHELTERHGINNITEGLEALIEELQKGIA